MRGSGENVFFPRLFEQQHPPPPPHTTTKPPPPHNKNPPQPPPTHNTPPKQLTRFPSFFLVFSQSRGSRGYSPSTRPFSIFFSSSLLFLFFLVSQFGFFPTFSAGEPFFEVRCKMLESLPFDHTYATLPLSVPPKRVSDACPHSPPDLRMNAP